jgi:glycosyltransferase involved in cell wall biosynthesis
MWDMTLPPRLAKLGRFIESRLAPPIYRRTPIVTLSESSKHELVADMGFKAKRVTVVSPGVDPRFSPGGTQSPTPLVVAVGRLVPVKRFDALVEVLVALKPDHPELRAIIVGEGYKRDELETQIHNAAADDWISLPGHISDDDLLDLYRRAWVVGSASAREGWGMTLTEAGACGTPSVVTSIAGHLDAVDDGRSGLVVGGRDEMVRAFDRILRDTQLRDRLSAGAITHAAHFTWNATALGTLEVLAAEARRHRSAPPR